MSKNTKQLGTCSVDSVPHAEGTKHYSGFSNRPFPCVNWQPIPSSAPKGEQAEICTCPDYWNMHYHSAFCKLSGKPRDAKPEPQPDGPTNEFGEPMTDEDWKPLSVRNPDMPKEPSVPGGDERELEEWSARNPVGLPDAATLTPHDYRRQGWQAVKAFSLPPLNIEKLVHEMEDELFRKLGDVGTYEYYRRERLKSQPSLPQESAEPKKCACCGALNPEYTFSCGNSYCQHCQDNRGRHDDCEICTGMIASLHSQVEELKAELAKRDEQRKIYRGMLAKAILDELLAERRAEKAEAELSCVTAERDQLRREIAFRDLAREQESNIAVARGTYAEIQSALTSEITMHAAWRKRANEAEAELAQLKASLSESGTDAREWRVTRHTLPVIKESGVTRFALTAEELDTLLTEYGKHVATARPSADRTAEEVAYGCGLLQGQLAVYCDEIKSGVKLAAQIAYKAEYEKTIVKFIAGEGLLYISESVSGDRRSVWIYKNRIAKVLIDGNSNLSPEFMQIIEGKLFGYSDSEIEKFMASNEVSK